MRTATLFVLAALLGAILGSGKSARADDVRPVSVLLQEREPGAFLVQWQVPNVLPPEAMPSPVLPASCHPEGERLLQEQAWGYVNRQAYRCSAGLEGQEIGIEYPFYNASISTMMRADLLSGDRYARLLNPGETRWTLPERAGQALGASLVRAQRGVLDGIRHAVRPAHLALLLGLCLLADRRLALRLTGLFTAGQVVLVLLAALFDSGLPAPLAEASVALAGLLLAREALRREPRSRSLALLVAAAGATHGLGLGQMVAQQGGDGGGLLAQLLVLAGLDGALVLLTAAGTAVITWSVAASTERVRRPLAYAAGSVAAAAALAVTVAAPAAQKPQAPAAARLPSAPFSAAEAAASLGTSRALAPQRPDAPIQSFLAVERFEIRHEVLLRLAPLAGEIGLVADGQGFVPVADQATLSERLGERVAAASPISVDGSPADVVVDRVDYMTVSPQGVLPRPEPVPELLADAVVGVTLVVATADTPNEVAMRWGWFPAGLRQIPATVIDPEATRTAILEAAEPTLAWTNELTTDPTPDVTAVAVEPVRLPVPLLSIPLALLAGFFAWRGLRRGQGGTEAVAIARLSFALTLLAAPVATVAAAIPGAAGTAPPPEQARRILAGVLPNVYRALAFRDEALVYDRLAVSVTGETLAQVYLEHRRALELAERGGARAQVEAVELLEVRDVRPADEGGFAAGAAWTVGGMVTHFGHRHFRQNRYDADVVLVPRDGVWKIRTLDVHEEERVR